MKHIGKRLRKGRAGESDDELYDLEIAYLEINGLRYTKESYLACLTELNLEIVELHDKKDDLQNKLDELELVNPLLVTEVEKREAENKKKELEEEMEKTDRMLKWREADVQGMSGAQPVFDLVVSNTVSNTNQGTSALWSL